MTRERIELMRDTVIPFVKKKLLEIDYEGLGESDAEEFEKDINEVLDMAIQALEQEPCEDAVSRETVITGIKDWWSLSLSTEGAPTIFDYIRELPPVTPTRKVGKWIYKNGAYICQFCGHQITGREEDLHFCCKCGERMDGE